MSNNAKSNRRSFLKIMFGFIGLFTAGGAGFCFFRDPPAGKIESIYIKLIDPAFATDTTAKSLDELRDDLIQKEIINTDGSINADQIKSNSKTGLIIKFQGKYYTESEYDLYRFAYKLCQLPSDQIEAYFG